jgi:HEAT repeat protein
MPELVPDAEAPAPTGPIVAPKLPLDDRPVTYAELIASRGQLDAQELVLRLRDGRPIVRANAALGLAALGHTGGDLVPFLRDGDPRVALAAAEALAHLGAAQRGHLVAIARALDGARPEVAETVQGMFAELVGEADAELVSVLDTGHEVAASTVVRACKQLGVRGLHLLQAATGDDRTRVRINAVRGIGQLGDLEANGGLGIA